MLRLRVHPLFIVLGVMLFFLGSGFAFIAYFITMVLHEMGHSAAAAHFGFRLDDVDLMPYGAALSGDADGMKTREEIMVALAGPAVNLALAVIFTALWWLVPAVYFFTEIFVTANVATALFNLLPVFPLDGGRVFLAALGGKMPRGKAVKIMRKAGCVMAAVFAALAVLSVYAGFNITYALIAVFMLTGAVTAGKAASYTRIKALAGRAAAIKKGLAVREVAVSEKSTLFNLSRLMHGAYYYKIIVMDEKMRIKRNLTESDFEKLISRNDLYATLGDSLGIK